jgi:hypothetical protein
VSTPSQPVGQTVSHYRILSRIGGGGMGVVYKSCSSSDDTRVWNRDKVKQWERT